MSAPDAAVASAIAADIRGETPLAVTRFSTGSMHYVFDVTFRAAPPLVIRIAGDDGAAAMRSASHLSRHLRPIGIPLPVILAENLDTRFPWLALERLEGTDLGHVFAHLGDRQLEVIAGRVAEAQFTVARTPNAGRYGYAATAEDAPHRSWADVVAQHLERSRVRIASAGLFDPALAEAAQRALSTHEDALRGIPATPFLHDTTTKNVICTATGEFSGIVDVDDLCFGDPRYVIALTRVALLSRGASTHYTDHWLALTGGRNDAQFRLYVALFLLDFMSEHGQRFNGNESPSLKPDRDRLQALFTQTLADVY